MYNHALIVYAGVYITSNNFPYLSISVNVSVRTLPVPQCGTLPIGFSRIDCVCVCWAMVSVYVAFSFLCTLPRG